jgi:hypothetical protein
MCIDDPVLSSARIIIDLQKMVVESCNTALELTDTTVWGLSFTPQKGHFVPLAQHWASMPLTMSIEGLVSASTREGIIHVHENLNGKFSEVRKPLWSVQPIRKL